MEKSEDKGKRFIIIVNAEEHEVDETVSYEQVVKLAYPQSGNDPNITYSVTFEKAKEPKQGTLAKGGTVQVKPRNTIFDVIEANRA